MSPNPDYPAVLGGVAVRTEPLPAWPPAPAGGQIVSDALDQSPVERLERDLARAHRVGHAVCWEADPHPLIPALAALGICPGGAVLAPITITEAAEAAISRMRAHVIEVELNRKYMDLDPSEVKRRILEAHGQRAPVQAVLVHHICDRMANMTRLARVCERMNVPLIEDTTQAMLSLWDGQGPASKSKAAILSLQSAGLLATGDGGAFLTNDAVLARTVRAGRERRGARMTDKAATVAAFQLRQWETDYMPTLDAAFEVFDAAIDAVPGLTTRPRRPDTRGPYGGKRLIVRSAELGLSTDSVRQILVAELGDPSTVERVRFNPRRFGRVASVRQTPHRPERDIWDESLVISPALALDPNGPSQLQRALEKFANHLPALCAWAKPSTQIN